MVNIIIIIIIWAICSLIIREKNNNIINFLSIDYTNILKGIAIICVVVNHVGQKYGVKIIEPLGTIGVCMFLVMSGYGINESCNKRGLENYFSKKFIRVLIPYWIIVILYNAITLKFEFFSFVKSLLLIKLVTPIFWYLRLIVYWYIIYYLIKKFVQNIKIQYIYMFAMSALISFVFIDNKVYIYQILSFPLGIIISENRSVVEKYIINNTLKVEIISLILVLISIILKKTPYVDARTYGVLDISIGIILDIVMTIFISTTVYILKKYKLFKFTKIIGKCSYEIYLIHPFFLYIISKDKDIIKLIEYLLIVAVLSGILYLVDKKLGKRKLKVAEEYVG